MHGDSSDSPVERGQTFGATHASDRADAAARVESSTETEQKKDVKETGRVDAFSDGVFAIAVTLLVLTIQIPDPKALVPHTLVGALLAKWPVYIAYIISFFFILIIKYSAPRPQPSGTGRKRRLLST